MARRAENQEPNRAAISADHVSALEMLDKDDLVKMVKSMMSSGIAINFHGKRTAQEIDKKVRPRQTLIKKELSVVGLSPPRFCGRRRFGRAMRIVIIRYDAKDLARCLSHRR